LTLPDLPDHTIKQCHGFLRELLYTFEEHYEHPLARAYGWASCRDEEDEDDF
jgi:hypothetical protein